jgi:hypothetical protein
MGLVGSVLTRASTVVQSGAILQSEIGGEVVALDIDKGYYYGLNQVGSRVWALMAEPASVSSICGALLEEFDVDPATCASEVLELLEEMRTKGMLEVREGISTLP